MPLPENERENKIDPLVNADPRPKVPRKFSTSVHKRVYKFKCGRWKK